MALALYLIELDDNLSCGKHERRGIRGGRAVIGEGAGSPANCPHDPAMEGPASTKAKARMKLKVRIDCLRFRLRRCRRFVGQLDTQGLFPDICAKSGKWFRGGENCFVAAAATKQFGAKSPVISVTAVIAPANSANGRSRTLVHWPSRPGPTFGQASRMFEPVCEPAPTPGTTYACACNLSVTLRVVIRSSAQGSPSWAMATSMLAVTPRLAKPASRMLSK